MNEHVRTISPLTRRQFVVSTLSAAGGLAIGIALPGAADAAMPLAAAPWGPDTPGDELSAWIVIDPDNTVTIRVPHAEMGQGAATALPQIVAEELACDWAKVKAEYASANRNIKEKGVYKDMYTVGSRGVRSSYQYLQQAGASARVRLIEAAAKRWNVPASDCVAEQGKVLHKASNRSIDYGAIAADAAKITLEKEPATKQPSEFKLIGQSVPRLDTPRKIDGTAQFGIDVKVPGMVYAAITACPVFGGKLKSVDEAAIKGRRGIERVVKLNDAVAVIADRYWRAKEALAALTIEWDIGDAGATNSAGFAKEYRDALDGPLVSARNDGNVDEAWPKGAKIIEATYEVPYLAHATMEPANTTVHVQPERMDIWVGTQSPTATTNAAARVAGLRPDQVYVHNAYLGGGFGRRGGSDDSIAQAVAIGKIIGKPVKLVWTREEDMRRDRYRPQAAARFKTALDDKGTPIAFEARVAVGSLLRSLGLDKVENGLEPLAVDCIANTAYRVPNMRVGLMLKNTHVPVAFWRSVGASQNGFFIESFIDELAHAAGQDPYRFRRAMIDRPDYLGVLDLIAEKSNWGTPMPAGRGRGMAILECVGSISGIVTEVTVSPKGEVTVDRIVTAVDCGHVVNPKIVESQLEGAIVFGLSAALYGEITIKDGRVEQGNFDNYEMIRMAQMPKIETYFALSGGKKWGGIGEPSTAPIAPAVANAIFAATGKRIRRLPLKNADLSSGA